MFLIVDVLFRCTVAVVSVTLTTNIVVCQFSLYFFDMKHFYNISTPKERSTNNKIAIFIQVYKDIKSETLNAALQEAVVADLLQQ